VRVEIARTQFLGKLGADLDAVAEQALQHGRDVGDGAVDVDRLGRQALLAREGEQLLGQRRAARHAAQRRVD